MIISAYFHIPWGEKKKKKKMIERGSVTHVSYELVISSLSTCHFIFSCLDNSQSIKHSCNFLFVNGIPLPVALAQFQLIPSQTKSWWAKKEVDWIEDQIVAECGFGDDHIIIIPCVI